MSKFPLPINKAKSKLSNHLQSSTNLKHNTRNNVYSWQHRNFGSSRVLLAKKKKKKKKPNSSLWFPNFFSSSIFSEVHLGQNSEVLGHFPASGYKILCPYKTVHFDERPHGPKTYDFFVLNKLSGLYKRLDHNFVSKKVVVLLPAREFFLCWRHTSSIHECVDRHTKKLISNSTISKYII